MSDLAIVLITLGLFFSFITIGAILSHIEAEELLKKRLKEANERAEELEARRLCREIERREAIATSRDREYLNNYNPRTRSYESAMAYAEPFVPSKKDLEKRFVGGE